jgi:hypothetical protein
VFAANADGSVVFHPLPAARISFRVDRKTSSAGARPSSTARRPPAAMRSGSSTSTYIPAVRNALQRHFQVPIKTGVPPEHAVCIGATTLDEH